MKVFEKIQNIYYRNTRQKATHFLDIKIPTKHILFIIFFLCLLCGINLFFKYQTFLALKQGNAFDVTILLHYTKGKNSERFKLQDSQGNIFYANYKGKFKNIVGKKARVYGKIYKCSFLQFLKSCTLYHSSLSLIAGFDSKRELRNFIANQHDSALVANLYGALFLADNLDRSLRQISMALGVAHLIAISGFHLAILSLFFYICICPIYFLLHRYFCYRNAFYDLSLLTLFFLCAYLILIDFEPSFFRAFIMACAGYFLLFCGLRIFSFLNLFLCVLIALAFNVSLIFHTGFLLSISGVFCIFLFIQYVESLFASLSKIWRLPIGILLFNSVIFLHMMPIVHYFFPYFSPYQFMSIPLSILFTLFFPFAIIMHCVGYGFVFDSLIISVTRHEFLMSEFFTPAPFMIVYIAILLVAMYFKTAYFISLIMAFLFLCFNVGIYYDFFHF